ncbi:hypothetical protein K439DRAFT_1633677 [Ramaria rubella]|nr:hypothetical protein K439DRAFT_1633677 [Ramaria rubella]
MQKYSTFLSFRRFVGQLPTVPVYIPFLLHVSIAPSYSTTPKTLLRLIPLSTSHHIS